MVWPSWRWSNWQLNSMMLVPCQSNRWMPPGARRAALALFANMNVTDHMDGLPWDSAEHDARVLTEAAQLAASPEPQPAVLAAPATGPQAGDWLARVDDWLNQAYAAQATLALDVARFDQDKVAQLLAALPPGMTPLTGPLDAAAFDQWLNLWQAGEPVVLDLGRRAAGLNPACRAVEQN